MKYLTGIRDFVFAIGKFLLGIVRHVSFRFDKKNEEKYCQICQIKKYPLQKVAYMIRAGRRKGDESEELFPFTEVLVCKKHHPDEDVQGADLSSETQEFLHSHKVCADCVYRYNVPEHVVRVGT